MAGHLRTPICILFVSVPDYIAAAKTEVDRGVGEQALAPEFAAPRITEELAVQGYALQEESTLVWRKAKGGVVAVTCA